MVVISTALGLQANGRSVGHQGGPVFKHGLAAKPFGAHITLLLGQGCPSGGPGTAYSLPRVNLWPLWLPLSGDGAEWHGPWG